MKLKDLNIKRINMEEIDNNYPGQDILFKLGELYQFESGIYGFGNLWTKLQKNIERIIIEELDKVGCIQMQFPILQPKSIWDRSDRWKKYVDEDNIMFTVQTDKSEYGIAPTAEECSVLFAADRLKSYRNLPATYYQIGEKFRKEMRPRGYLFRPRTFVMMDAYSFDKDEQSMERSYEKIKQAYTNIFNRIGLKVIPIVADNGSMGGKKSEEWMTITELGEDTILYDEKTNIGINTEILERENCKEYLTSEYGINDIENMKEYKTLELGHNFQLDTKYSDNMKLFFSDKNNSSSPYYMGCYGMGIGRVVAVTVENSVIKVNNQIKGLSFPICIAPYLAHIVYKETDPEKENLANELYIKMEKNNMNCIIDDRQDITFGAKIKDALLLGCPYIAIIGNRNENEMIELENTKTNEKTILQIDDAVAFFKKITGQMTN